MSTWDEIQRTDEDVSKMNKIIRKWRVPGFVRVRPRSVIPDTSNRVNTGLSAVHVHWIATQITLNGFDKRDNELGTGHDIPVLVAESSNTELGVESLEKWTKLSQSDTKFPQIQFSETDPFFCSLGSGHFFQSLNVIGEKQKCMFALGEMSETSAGAYISDNQIGDAQVPAQYAFEGDQNLQEALEEGVDSIVLKPGISLAERNFVSLLHNNLFEYPWKVTQNGEIEIDRAHPKEASTWEFVSKKSDAWELEELLKLRLRLQSRRRTDAREQAQQREETRVRLEKAEQEKQKRRLARQAKSRSHL